MTWRAALGLAFVVAVALFLRAGDLASRPLHNDEAINAFKLERLWRSGAYTYDPDEYHGPTLYYLGLPVAKISSWLRGGVEGGFDEVGMRWVTVVFGVGLILVTGWMAKGLGTGGYLAGALAVAVSPAFVYYSRYFIHEILLVFFTTAALGAGWHYSRKPSGVWAAVFGASVALMFATKETFVFNLTAMAVAWGVLVGFGRGSESPGSGAPKRPWQRCFERVRAVPVRHALLAAGVSIWVWVLFYSSFFSNPKGPADSIRSYFIWLERAGGTSPHVHPWWFYWKRLMWFHERGAPVWTEGCLLMLGAAGGWMAWTRREWDWERRRLGAFLACYTLVLAAIYTVLPYKTPWCLLGFYHGILLLSGMGLSGLWEIIRGRLGRLAMIILVAAGIGHLGVQAWRGGREYGADFRNPYVYGHTSADITNLLEQVRELVAVHPDGRLVRVNVMAPGSGYWPLPWSLRDLPNVGWWDRIPEEPYTPIMIVASKLKGGFEEGSRQAWLMVGLFELRPRYFVELYVQADLWERFLARRRAQREASGG